MECREEESDYDMVCTSPISIKVPVKGMPKIFQEMEVPCGKCLACRIKKRQEWSMRMLHELSYHDKSVFLTLTYNNYYVPSHGGLSIPELQNFFKRLRKDNPDKKIKYFACGEYGEEKMRPHYHAIVFGLGLTPEDKNSVIKCWPYCDWDEPDILKNSFGIAEPDSIRYVAQYIDKKYSGDMEIEMYLEQGLQPVFRLMSQGIGERYACDNHKQIKDLGYITVKGTKQSVPRYYIKKLELDTSTLTQYAVYSESEQNERWTGINISSDDAERSLNPELINKIYEGKMRSNKQRNKNLEVKSTLKKRKF
nr:MAG: replication initiator protein [Microvirus sp.]